MISKLKSCTNSNFFILETEKNETRARRKWLDNIVRISLMVPQFFWTQKRWSKWFMIFVSGSKKLTWKLKGQHREMNECSWVTLKDSLSLWFEPKKKNSLTKVQKMIKKVVAHWRICRHDPAIKSENGYRLASLHWVVFRVTFLLPRHHFGVHFRTKRAMLLLLRNERASHI